MLLKKVKLERTETPLDSLLSELNIPVYTSYSVKEYKKQKQERIKKSRKKRISHILILISCISFLLFSFFAMVFISEKGSSKMEIAVGILSLLFLFIGCSAFIKAVYISETSEWVRVPLSNSDIPLRLLKKIYLIKEKIPDAEFFIEELKGIKNDEKFLFVVHRGKTYYLAIWNNKLDI